MAVVNPEKGKAAGGSIVMTASGECFHRLLVLYGTHRARSDTDIFIAQVAGIRSGAGPIDYSASKAAVNSLAKVGAYQLTGKNVRVNAICPGLIEVGFPQRSRTLSSS
jgi:NAD(P)-dependent dehydrogenase (short-subunit alcohol dehydrogenase family)